MCTAAAAGYAPALAPGRWLGPLLAPRRQERQEQQQQEQSGSSSGAPASYGVELTAEQWDPLGLTALQAEARGGSGGPSGRGAAGGDEGVGNFFKGDLPKKLAMLLVRAPARRAAGAAHTGAAALMLPSLGPPSGAHRAEPRGRVHPPAGRGRGALLSRNVGVWPDGVH